jgi:hypothetical protein
MPLRLSPDGARVLDEWLKHRTPPPEDRQRVADIVRAIASGANWQIRWFWYNDPADPDITVIQPRDGLHVFLRLWADNPDEFTIVSIADIPSPGEG